MAYMWWPVLLGGVHSAGISTFFQIVFQQNINAKQTLAAGLYGAGTVVLGQYLTLQWQRWLKRQLLYQMYLFSGTRLYRDLYWMKTTGSRVGMGVGIYASAAVAGGVLGAAVGIGISQAVWGQSGRDSAVQLYTGKVGKKEYTSKMKLLWQSFIGKVGELNLGPEAPLTFGAYDHDPYELNYSFGPTSQEKQKSEDFPLGINPIGGPIIV